jgi:hypothetical protein
MKKILGVVICSLAAALAFAGASTGNCQSKAVALKASQSVTLVNQWDSEWDEYYDSGVYFYKVTLTKNTPATIWISGGDAADMMLDVYTDFDSDYYTTFETGTTDDGSVQYARLRSDEWDEEDPSKVTFYVEVSGDIGMRADLFFSNSYQSFVPVGSADNPLALTFKENEQSTVQEFVEGDFYIESRLQAGRYYRVRTEGGTAESPFTVDVDQGEDVDFLSFDDPAYSNDLSNASLIFSPSLSGTYTIDLSGGSNEFKFVYQLLKNRTPAEHNPLELSAENGFSAEFVPGRQIASWDYGDDIIDEGLFAIKLAKGDRYVFETSGAVSELKMVLYNSKGEVFAENRTLDGTSQDVRTTLEAPAAGMYYIGVCDYFLEPYETVAGSSVTITATKIENAKGDPDEWDNLDDSNSGAAGLEALPGNEDSIPFADGSVHGPHRLSKSDWFDTFVIAARKGLTYRVGFEYADESVTSALSLNVSVYTLSGTREIPVVSDIVDPAEKGFFEITAEANTAYYIRCSVAEGNGLDYPDYNVRAVAYASEGADLGILKVNTMGAVGAEWSLDRETVKYPGGSSVLIAGEHTVKFYSVTGFTTPASENITVNAGTTPTVLNVYYSDKLDPKDDVAKTATSWTLKSTATEQVRTLWRNDPEDNFTFAAKDGEYYTFKLLNNTGDAVFSITNAEQGVVVENVTSVDKLALAGVKSKYYLTVKHANSDEPQDGSYTLSGFFSNVGAIKFAQNAVSAKENAASVKLTINRTAKDGLVRVKYGTVAGTAVPGVDYVAQNGVLEWKNGDNKAKTIEIKLIPDLVAHYEGNKDFSVQLKPFEEDELKDVEYPAQITSDICVVTLTEVSSAGTTVESTYASKAVKLATVKTENVALETGTFYGVLAEDGFALTNGLPALASVTLTVSTKDPAALSAKVMLAGKTYNFKGTGWESDEGSVRKQTLSLVQKVANVTYTNTLTLAVNSGTTTNGVDWLAGVGSAELVMNVPDANNKGAQEDIRYAGSIYRYNDKVQDYLNVVTNFAGYYTVALAPRGVSVADGIPAGNGYITIKIDNKGGAKIAGKLADAKNSVSISAKACGIIADEESANGYSMYIPLYTAKNPMCFGGELRIFADKESGNLVVDSSRTLVYKNDDPKFTYDNYEGFSMDIEPIGGWYDLLINLQTYYLTMQFAVETADVYELPLEAFTAGYNPVGGTQPTGAEVTLQGDAFATAKKSLFKNGNLYDLEGSINPCNVQVKLARATGLVTGSFSVWSESDDGLKQKEVTGFKHFGVLLPVRDSYASLGSEYAVLGYCTKSFNITNENPDTGKTVKHSWNFSAPFNIFGYDYGDIDWWADDWGINPEN